MSYGFQAINNSNIVQIDSDFANYAIFASGTAFESVTLTLPNINGVRVFVTVAFDYYINLDTVDPSPGSSITITAGGSFKYKIVVPSTYFTDITTGYGFNVYTATGVLAFSSEKRYLNIAGKGVFELAYPPYWKTYEYYSVPAPSTSQEIYIDILAAAPCGDYSVTYEGGWSDSGLVYLYFYRDTSNIWINTGNASYIQGDILGSTAIGHITMSIYPRTILFATEI